MPMKSINVAELIRRGNGRYNVGGSLYLVVRGGSALWEYQFRQNKRLHSVGLGSAVGPAQVTLTAARQARAQTWLDRKHGVNSSFEKASADPAQKTFGEAHETYRTNHAAEWSERQQVQVARLFKNHTGPLDRLPVKTITSEQVADVLRPVWRGPAAGQGARLRQLMEHVFRAAGIKGEANPAIWDSLRDLLSKKTVKAKAHPAMAHGELPAFMIELAGERNHERKPGAGRPPNKTATDHDTVARCLRFCILTATRSAEAIGADWSEIDLAKKLWTIPADRMKMDTEHTIPLSDAAIALLGTPRKAGLVFTVSSTRTGAVNKDGLLKHLREYRATETVHGFRSTFATWAEDAGHKPNVIESALAHQKGDATTRAYLRSKLLPARRKLMDEWAVGVLPPCP
jgi:integrase